MPIIVFDKNDMTPFIFCVVNRKIPNISPGTYILQRPLLRGLFLEGLIYGGKIAFQNRLGLTWREICVSKSTGLTYSWKEICQ